MPYPSSAAGLPTNQALPLQPAHVSKRWHEAEAQQALTELFPHLRHEAYNALRELFPIQSAQ